MRKQFNEQFKNLIHLIWGTLLVLPFIAGGQQLSRAQFILFGGTGVELGKANTVKGNGAIGSYQQIKTNGITEFAGNLHSGGIIDLGNLNKITGTITVGNSNASTNTIFNADLATNINGDILANGNIVIKSGSVTGKVTQPEGAVYSGPTPSGGKFTITPPSQLGLPILPVLPTGRQLSPGSQNISTGKTIAPGAYGDLILKGNQVLKFSQPGEYIFNSINLSNANNFVFDFSNNPAGRFTILVKGNMLLDRIGINYLNAGSGATSTSIAKQIYTEVQGLGSDDGYSFSIGNGFSYSRSKWLGTVYAVNGSIKIGWGSLLCYSDIIGALWSGKKISINSGVDLLFSALTDDCSNKTASINNGSETSDIPCSSNSILLNGTTNISNPIYTWTTQNGNIVSGQSTPTITVSTAGRYTLTVTNSGGCVASDDIDVTSCINGAINGNPFKVATVVDAVLTQQITGGYTDQQKADLFIFNPEDPTQILIEAILQDNNIVNAKNYLTANGFNQSGISNNPGYVIITGFYAQAKLPDLNLHPELYKYVRAVTPPVTFASSDGGLYKSGGDSAIGTRSVRAGYGLSGATFKDKNGQIKPIKIGVISDSYNRKGAATTDISNGDLPGTVDLSLGDYPFAGNMNDEGRAMMQIIHEEASGAQLAFRTGFVSEGDMAEGIRQLKAIGCNIIVDDITYATAPFFKDGLITKAIQEVTKDSVIYFTSAGNFGNKAFEGKFSPSLSNGSAVPIPGGNIVQRLKVNNAGSYIVVLQWDDDFYSAGSGGTGGIGAQYDLDIFLTDYTGKNILGYNRVNSGSDPIEVLPFSVTDATTVYLKVVKAGGPTSGQDVSYKYILFKGSGEILDAPNANPSTIIGHANAREAITVGAVQYNLTPAYGVPANLMKAEPFSSWGGPTKGIDNLKPDFSAPDGVNTSVTLGDRPLLDINGNTFTDPEQVAGITPHYFFGTSAAAPHAAGLAALLLEARAKFNPAKPAFGYLAMRDTLKKTSTNIIYAGEDPSTGFDYKSGAGLINAANALLTEANPTPVINSLTLTQNSGGATVIKVVVDGNYLSDKSTISIDNSPVPTTVDLSTRTLSAEIEPFIGNPLVTVCSPSVSETGLDGQCSNAVNILDQNRVKITLRAKSYTKKYGEPLPALDYDLLIGDDPTPVDKNQPLPGGLTLLDLGLVKPGPNPGDPLIAAVHVTTAANATSDAGNALAIKVTVDGFSPGIPLAYAKLYNYVFLDGGLTIEKLKVTIKPKDQTINYGNEIQQVQFEYTTPGTSTVDQGVIDSIKAEHNRYIANGYALVRGFDGSLLDHSNLAMMITETGLQNANAGATRANGGVTRANVVDVSADALNYYLQNRLTNGGVTRANGIPFDNGATRANGGVTRANGGVTRANTVVYADAIINGFVVVTSNGGVTRANVSGGNPNAAANGGVTRANGGVTRANYITFTANGGVTRANVILNSDPSATPYGFADISIDGTNGVVVNAIPNSSIQNGVLANSGGDITLVNSALFTANSNSNVAVLLDDEDISKGYVEGYISINLITGLSATGPYHPHKIIPGAYLPVSNNYDITYEAGNLFVNKSPMSIQADNITVKYKDEVKFSSTVTGYLYNPETDALDDSTIFNGGLNYGVSRVINNIIVPFTGPVYPVASYTITPLFSQPQNYLVTPQNGITGVLTVNKAEQTITVNTSIPSSSQYGNSFSISATASSGLPITYSSSLPLTNSGSVYTMMSGIGTGKVKLNQPGDDNFNPAPEISTDVAALKVSLTINMNQDVYYFYQGGSLPAFSSSVNGLVSPDIIKDNTYTTTSGISLNSSMPAGQYTVIRNINSNNLPNLESYTINNNGATLYVNPSVSYCKAIKPILVCVEQLSVPVNGFSYRARYSYQNGNSVAIYVPNGSDNKIIPSTGAAFSGNPPEIFQPGTTQFYIYFNGKKITWYLNTYDKNKKSASTSDASSTSNRCNSNSYAINSELGSSGMEQVLLDGIYPNPASNQIYIEGDFSRATEKDLIVVDVLGRQVRPNAVNKLSSRKFRLDISNLISSQYFITVQNQFGRKVYKFIKP